MLAWVLGWTPLWWNSQQSKAKELGLLILVHRTNDCLNKILFLSSWCGIDWCCVCVCFCKIYTIWPKSQKAYLVRLLFCCVLWKRSQAEVLSSRVDSVQEAASWPFPPFPFTELFHRENLLLFLVSIQPLPCPQRLPSLPISVRNCGLSLQLGHNHTTEDGFVSGPRLCTSSKSKQITRVNNDPEDLELQVWKSFMSKSFMTHGPACFIGFKFYLQQLKKHED